MVRLEIDAEIIRLRLLLVVMVFVLGYVMYEVHELQVVDRQRYAANVAQQSIRHVRVPGWRGRMFDRNGICVADNRPSHCIAIYPSEPGVRQRGKFSATIDRVDEMVDEIAEVLDREREISKGEIEKHILEQRLLPLIAWRDLDDTAVARFAEQLGHLPGVDLITEADRWYPFGESACHILGYVGRGGMGGSEEQRYDFYLKEMEGKAGLESRYDDILRGEAGSQLIRVDVSLFQHSILVNREPEAGSDLQLAMDIRLQNIAERVLDRKRGACCIINPATGHVLALASYPRYDLNEFGRIYNQLRDDPRLPLINRAVQNHYPPGSTIKPLVAMAGLVAGKTPPNQIYYCPGYFELGGSKRYCAMRSGHGNLNMRQAIQRSCNVYFWEMGIELGYDYIYHMAAAVGLGSHTGIELGRGVDKPGILPDGAWKREHGNGDHWRDGDTCNVAIGQGYLNATPLQMGMVAATLANGGTLYRPQLIAGIRHPGDEHFTHSSPEVANELNWDRWMVSAIKAGMEDVVMTDEGSAKAGRIEGFRYAGKTGTAQFGQRGNTIYRCWMIAYAPADNPQYAVSLMVEEGDGSATDAVPRMKRVMEGIFFGGDGA